jgi:hypothetical protein
LHPNKETSHMNKNIELFGPKVDYLLLPALAALLVFMFYGTTAAVASAATMAVIIKLKPLRVHDMTEQRLALVAAGLVLSLSLFLRSFFHEGYCFEAPWSVNREMREFLDVNVPCFTVGGYLQYAFASVTSAIRDIVMPIAGLALLWVALPHGLRRTGLAATAIVLVAGLASQWPLSRSSAEEASGEAATGVENAEALDAASKESVDRQPPIPSTLAQPSPPPAGAPDDLDANGCSPSLAKSVGLSCDQ